MKDKPLVSVIIPTFNSDRFIERCLRSIKNQTYPSIEVIVVDRNSSDRTVVIAKDFDVKIYVIDADERCAQMNFGMRMALGDFLYIVGSDFLLESTIIEEATEKCIRDNYDAIRIHNTSDPTVSFWAKVRKLERDCYAGDELNVAARFFRKEVLDKVGGFNEKLVAAEDYDMHNRLLQYGFRVGEISSKEIHLGEPRKLKEIALKHYYYGATIKRFVQANSRRGIRQISPLRPSLVRNYRNFFRHPSLTIGFILYQIVKYQAATLGFLSSLGES